MYSWLAVAVAPFSDINLVWKKRKSVVRTNWRRPSWKERKSSSKRRCQEKTPNEACKEQSSANFISFKTLHILISQGKTKSLKSYTCMLGLTTKVGNNGVNNGRAKKCIRLRFVVCLYFSFWSYILVDSLYVSHNICQHEPTRLDFQTTCSLCQY